MRPFGLIDALKGAIGPGLSRPAELQVGALCWREKSGRREYLLVNTLNTRRWIVPKGWPMKGRSLAEAASIEAWEEAGVRGRLGEQPIGSYVYDKLTDTGLPVRCEVQVFPIEVSELADSYPEKRRRDRRWVTREEAMKLLGEPDLKRLIATV
ncbi:NUDIX hydrolase [Haematobacter massiliensis]|uniref:NUDIX hydrolase n=1 Tax=Haematobacter massiliensis TaxID=195105 RepID=A0A086YA52_9RHOB|nr:NUDIX hydrolase [Haematobacter massiliensis]KFI31152.1 NUDIX hydrolase [Haematobacter massiliensis]OWJ69677.1 NUDIX hydrolase [Haematobacter massiliensis]OWJ88743.1 NUDIX hydrolase [Haematobacter massiliensis]QBJ23232.1 NUDIX hydrolase [Haematobacter massiliensis]